MTKNESINLKDRFQIINLLSKETGNLGIELGVASGDFSKKMVMTGRFSKFFGIDMYADHHDTAEYVRALDSIGIFSDYKLLRMRFDEALPLFPDESLDFVYVDGYAHTGEDGGRTIFEWLAKVRIGGVLAGHDYHPEWPLVMESVNELGRQTGFEVLTTGMTEDAGPQDRFPSWAMIKTAAVAPSAPKGLDARIPPHPAIKLADPLAAPFAARARQAAKLLLGTRAHNLYSKIIRS